MLTNEKQKRHKIFNLPSLLAHGVVNRRLKHFCAKGFKRQVSFLTFKATETSLVASFRKIK